MNIFKQLILLLISWLKRSSEPKDTVLSDFERVRQSLKPGDVILVEGRSTLDNKIKKLTQSQWSHSALYIGRLIDIEDSDIKMLIRTHIDCESDTPLIVHSKLGVGTCIEHLLELEREHLRICRPKGLAKKDTEQTIRYALSVAGTDKEEYQLFDILRFFFPWSLLPQSWRLPAFKYNFGKHVELASSNLIANAFGFVQFPIMPLVKTTQDGSTQLLRRKPKLCLPADFDTSPYFEIVKYPFIDFANYSGHNLIPWKGSGVLSGEEPNLHIAHASNNLESKP
ncbi:MAG: hypothetical protein MI867_04305 [Pseudomonadales bacterium]|nr:hypothetical protein [Pseudomonadales bacterium]